MEVKYSFRMEASCPVDNMGDLYDVVITSDKPIPVEDTETCFRIGQSVMFDNGAFSLFTRGEKTNWGKFYDW